MDHQPRTQSQARQGSIYNSSIRKQRQHVPGDSLISQCIQSVNARQTNERSCFKITSQWSKKAADTNLWSLHMHGCHAPISIPVPIATHCSIPRPYTLEMSEVYSKAKTFTKWVSGLQTKSYGNLKGAKA